MNKGFTLIELLAVIVILAIIALIATPIVLSIIEDSKNSAMIRSSEMYLDGVEYSIAKGVLNNIRVKDDTYNILSSGNICIKYNGSNCETELEVEVKGEKPISGTITIEGGVIKNHTLNYVSNVTIVDGSIQKENSMTLAQFILKQAKDNNYYYTTTPNFSKETQEEEYGLYQAQDDLGTSYYFRGDVENNYVQFGQYTQNGPVLGYDEFGDYDGTYESVEECEDEVCQYLYEENSLMYWRIIRINGDGTIRMIYDGTEKVANGIPHSAYIGYEEYNVDYFDPKYVGYTYDVSGTEKNSTIKAHIDNWYINNLKNKYETYIADSIFCNDKEIAKITYWDEYWEEESETPTDYYYIDYAPYTRLESSVPQPKLTCTRPEDRYTTNSEKKIGNGLLSNPVGLITADEVALSGGVYENYANIRKQNNYLYTGDLSWTSTPSAFDSFGLDFPFISVYGVIMGGFDNPDDTGYEWSVRPVINLKADVKFTGDGSFDNPYVIVTE